MNNEFVVTDADWLAAIIACLRIVAKVDGFKDFCVLRAACAPMRMFETMDENDPRFDRLPDYFLDDSALSVSLVLRFKPDEVPMVSKMVVNTLIADRAPNDPNRVADQCWRQVSAARAERLDRGETLSQRTI